MTAVVIDNVQMVDEWWFWFDRAFAQQAVAAYKESKGRKITAGRRGAHISSQASVGYIDGESFSRRVFVARVG